jgi:hypothetical protein
MVRYRDFAWAPKPWAEGWGEQTDVTVWISIVKLDASWSNDDTRYLGGQGGGARADQWIMNYSSLWMPHIALDDTGIVSFTDGRKRFAWMRDHGAKALPVTCSPGIAAEIKRRFGSRSRRTRVCR